ncbi:hypothetical protein Godav_021135 [Gossypium davidsonii]|uniref:Uncharacterized protein n=2 Tax=Gossypium TaxID=3633 RepID=A0A7J8R5L7_GOSDV|nr:hypothetical protein [Gossypium davidsonii]MBA0670071.1 hypothetical protein [Gossypium klotzschianum]
METKDTHIPSSLWRVYNYTREHQCTTQSIGRWGCRYEANYYCRLECNMRETTREGVEQV